ncbi:MAG: hypothetical protein BGO78_09620 [Chloroflexi bacterium 44-23]|nr:MAG: hypothetical protein BGO78_09620 [Chloroflexi bacterium 44-23]
MPQITGLHPDKRASRMRKKKAALPLPAKCPKQKVRARIPNHLIPIKNHSQRIPLQKQNTRSIPGFFMRDPVYACGTIKLESSQKMISKQISFQSLTKKQTKRKHKLTLVAARNLRNSISMQSMFHPAQRITNQLFTTQLFTTQLITNQLLTHQQCQNRQILPANDRV